MSFNKNEQENFKGHTVKDTESQGHTQIKKKTDAVDRLNRKTSILNFIKQNKEAQIKDILTHIGDCSEKTIQRELNELIKDGVLKKEGDRRWSKYSLLKDIR
jgi:predicted HTH transcriptional regulator